VYWKCGRVVNVCVQRMHSCISAYVHNFISLFVGHHGVGGIARPNFGVGPQCIWPSRQGTGMFVSRSSVKFVKRQLYVAISSDVQNRL